MTILLWGLIASGVHAQQGPKYRIGLTFAPSLSWFSPDTRDYISEGTRMGTSFGLIGEYHLSYHYVISTNFLVSSFGGKLRYRDDVPAYGVHEIQRDYRLRYFEVPVTFKGQTSQFGYMTYFGRIGFAPGFNLKATGDDQFSSGSTGITLSNDIKGEIPLIRLAFVAGAGAEYSLGGRMSLVGQLLYSNGFTNNLKGRNRVSGAAQSATSNYISLHVGVIF
jgi:hypothetical protein